MARDVAQALREYDDAPTTEPMRAQPGQIRNALSTDEKKIKRAINRSGGSMSQPRTATTASIAGLLAQASRADSLTEQQQLMGQATALQAAQRDQHAADRAYHPEESRVMDTLVPARVHERTSSATDWLLDIETTASLEDGSQEMLAQASLWYGRVGSDVKSYRGEYEEQARNKAHRLASQYGDVADKVERVFLDESSRLHALGMRAGEFTLVSEGLSDPGEGEPGSLQAEAGIVEDVVDPMKTGQDTEGLDQRSDEVAQQYTGGANVPQTDASGGNAVYPNEADTSSNRAPALQQLAEGDQGWDGSSVVPQGDSGAAAANQDSSGPRDDARPSAGFPVGATRTASVKESHMHAQCPSCGGTGHVAVRQLDPREAYSGLPQIDEIVGNDDHPGTAPAPGQSEPFPSDVAFPWNMNPANVQNTISEAEQQIANRPQGRPGAPGGGGGPGGSVQAAQYQANGRDNSGWIGDMGAKGLDYPGNSTPVYDGSTNLGQPDPVYGEGGDNPNAPHTPFGAQEAADYTNDPGQNWQPGQPTQDDQAYRSVTPSMNTQGGFHPDPTIAEAQEQILAWQARIAQRNQQLQQAGY